MPTAGVQSLARLRASASGIYLATVFGLWSFGWTRIAIPTLVVVAALGAVVAPHRNRVVAAIRAHAGALPLDVQAQLRYPLDLGSWCLRGALLIGLVLEMTLKPDAGLLTMTPFALAGLVCAGTAWVG